MSAVIPGLIIDAPLVLIGAGGLYLQWRSLRKHVDKVTTEQTREFQQQLNKQTRQIAGTDPEDER